MFVMKKYLIGLAVLSCFCSLNNCGNPESNDESLTSLNQNQDQIVPGPRTCFWTRGPVSADPYMNIAYPDAGVFYWSAVFTIPPGANLTLEGEFPHSRYMSLISYNQRGIPQESLADYLITPDPGHTNPFVIGADRTAVDRSYSITVEKSTAPPMQVEGIRIPRPELENMIVAESRVANTLHAPPYGNNQQSLIYRIYAKDKDTDETGNAGLPIPVLTMADGTVYKGAEACTQLRSSQPLMITPDAVGITMEKYYEITRIPDRPIGHPATNPPSWYMQVDRQFLIGMYTGEMPGEGRKSTGGFYPNVDNNYIRTFINRKFGKVFVIRGKIPSTPKTWNGDDTMTKGELVYWSICSVQGFVITRVNDCLFDEQVPLGPNGEFTIVVSKEEDRPRNARPECGMAWLPIADDGDGVNDPDLSVLQIRNLLADPNFKNAIQYIDEIGTEKEVMGEYFPKSFYTSTGAFEVFFPCLAES